eukprot:4169074-Prymnesium_polylepis.1
MGFDVAPLAGSSREGGGAGGLGRLCEVERLCVCCTGEADLATAMAPTGAFTALRTPGNPSQCPP